MEKMEVGKKKFFLFVFESRGFKKNNFNHVNTHILLFISWFLSIIFKKLFNVLVTAKTAVTVRLFIRSKSELFFFFFNFSVLIFFNWWLENVANVAVATQTNQRRKSKREKKRITVLSRYNICCGLLCAI